MRRFKFILFAILVAPLLMGAQARCSLTRKIPGQTYVAGFVQDKDVGAVNAMFNAAEAAVPKPVERPHE